MGCEVNYVVTGHFILNLLAVAVFNPSGLK